MATGPFSSGEEAASHLFINGGCRGSRTTTAGAARARYSSPHRRRLLCPHRCARAGGHQYTVYFSANDGTTGEELWAYNSINGTTWQVIDLKPIGGYIGDIHVHEGDVYFAGEDNWDGRELWRLIFSKDVAFV